MSEQHIRVIYLLLAGLFFGATCPLTSLTGNGWQTLALFSFIGPFAILWLGLKEGFLSSALSVVVATVFVTIGKQFMGMPYNMVSFGTEALMILVLVKFALLSRVTDSGSEEWYPSGKILGYMVFVAIAGMLAQLAIETSPALSDEMLRQIAQRFASSSDLEDHMYETLKLLVQYNAAITALSSFIVVLSNAAFAQKSLERKKLNIRPAGSFSLVSLPCCYLWVVAAAAGLTVLQLNSVLGLSILGLLCVPFVLVGLSLVHEKNRQYGLGTITLVVFYVVMITFGWRAAVALSLIGLLEPWLRSEPKVIENQKR